MKITEGLTCEKKKYPRLGKGRASGIFYVQQIEGGLWYSLESSSTAPADSLNVALLPAGTSITLTQE